MSQEDVTNLVRIVSTMSDPLVTNTVRKEAYETYESVKKGLSANQKISLGYTLARNTESLWNVNVIHFGLQMLEDTIKYSWPSARPEEKQSVKNIIIDLISTSGSTSQAPVVLEGVARLVAELIKREWPQQWPTMLSEMESITCQGPSQLQIVILVFQRFVEDLVQFKSLPPSRHKEVNEALTTVMPEFIIFLVHCLENGHILSTSVNILHLCAALGEFAQIKHLWEQNGILFDTLLLRPVDEDLYPEIAEFLLSFLSRKHSRKKDVLLVLQFFSEDKYFFALTKLLAKTKQKGSITVYKRLCEIFAWMPYQLAQVGDLTAYLTEYQANFENLLKVLIGVTQEENPSISSLALPGWLTLWGNRTLRVLPSVTSTMSFLLQKCCYLSLLRKSTDCEWTKKEFGSQEDLFREFLHGMRAKIVELVRRISCALPKDALEYTFGILEALMVQNENNASSWSAVLVLLEGTTRSLPADVREACTPRMFHLMDRMMQMDRLPSGSCDTGEAASIRLSHISRISTVFIPNPSKAMEAQCSEMVCKVISHDLFILTSTIPNGSIETRDETKEALHFHARHLFTTLCRSLSTQLIAQYDQLVLAIRSLFDSARLSVDDKCTLLDGLITVTKSCSDKEKIARLRDEIMGGVSPFWLSEEFSKAVDHPGKFLSYCGLDKPLAFAWEDAEFVQKRSQILFCSHVISSTFMFMKFDTPEAKILIKNAFALLNCFMKFHQPEIVRMLPKENQSILSMSESEVQNILKTVYVEIPQESNLLVKRVQNWLQSVFESVCRIIGYADRCFGITLHKNSEFLFMMQDSLINAMSVGNIPIFRVRTIIRELVAHLICNTPVDAAKIFMIPFFKKCFPVMANVLNTAWSTVDFGSEKTADILANVLLRCTTKDYATMVLQKILCDQQRFGKDVETPQDTDMQEDTDNENEKPAAGGSSNQPKFDGTDQEVSQLGLLCLQEPEIADAVLNVVFNGLWWNDSNNSCFFTRLLQILLKRIVKPNEILLNTESVKSAFRCIMESVHNHAQQDWPFNVGLRAYFLIKPLFPREVEEVLKSSREFLATPDVSKQDAALKHLDNQLYTKGGGKNLYSKANKDAFKRIVAEFNVNNYEKI